MLFPAVLSSERGFSSCVVFHSLCLLGPCPINLCFVEQLNPLHSYQPAKGCVQHVTCATSIIPRLGGLVSSAALSLWSVVRELCPAQSPGRWVDLRCESEPNFSVYSKEGKRRAAWAAPVARLEPWQ